MLLVYNIDHEAGDAIFTTDERIATQRRFHEK